ncbi:MAG: simple sugar transport system permease protein [Desulforhopalus sp.]|jgi:simple sugar transport system permease protein
MQSFVNYMKFNAVQWTITFVFIVLLLGFMFFAPHTFLHSRIYIAYLSTIPFAGMIAIAMTLVIITGEIDLSFPSVMAASGFAFAKTYAFTSSPGLGLVAALATGALAGALNGVLVVGFKVPSIIATIGTQFFWRGLTVLLASGLALNMAEIRETTFHYLMVGRWFDWLPAQAVWFSLLTALFWLLLNRHVLGDHVRFCGDNSSAAQMMGIPVSRTRISVFCHNGHDYRAFRSNGLYGNGKLVAHPRRGIYASCFCRRFCWWNVCLWWSGHYLRNSCGGNYNRYD